jgi:hypothetical protein
VTDRRRPGEVVVLREFHGDRLWAARPAFVLRDDGDDLSFFIPEGTRGVDAVDDGGAELRLPHAAWRLERSARPGRRSVRSFASTRDPHAVLAIWDEGWRPRCWYVNLQLPLRRSAVGFDTTDLVLDLVGTPDASAWRWKDEDELAEAIAAGTVDTATADRIRGEAEALAGAVTAGRPPFDGDPWSWRPDPSWGVPDLPDAWDRR